MSLKISLIREVKSPDRANKSDAGIDFYVPKFTDSFLKDFSLKNPLSKVDVLAKTIMLEPQERTLIPSGVKVNVPLGNALILVNKSGVSTKKGLDVLACVIDTGYQGECHISLVNTGDQAVWIKENEKIVQGILFPVNLLEPEQVPEDELFIEKTSRGEGGFGSTDAKNHGP